MRESTGVMDEDEEKEKRPERLHICLSGSSEQNGLDCWIDDGSRIKKWSVTKTDVRLWGSNTYQRKTGRQIIKVLCGNAEFSRTMIMWQHLIQGNKEIKNTIIAWRQKTTLDKRVLGEDVKSSQGFNVHYLHLNNSSVIKTMSSQLST